MFIRFLCLLLSLTIPAHAQMRGAPENRQQLQLSFAPIVKQSAPAVVNIYTKRTVSVRQSHPFFNDPFFNHFFRHEHFGQRMRKKVENSLGSGVIIDKTGRVITNAHVVKGAEEITVILADGREFDATLALRDEPSDLAVLKIDTSGESMPYISLRPSETLEVGDLVLAIGNPFGVGQTVTSGIVSAKARSTLDINDFNFFIQTDAAINPGNSGGALVALDGGVVGINTAIYSRDGGSLGIGFAIPSEMVATVLAAETMGQSGDKGIIRPWLGITAQSVTSDIAESLGMPKPRGALVAGLHPASPLVKANIKVGDAILSINGHNIRDPQELKFRMATVPLGQTASFEIIRAGKRSSHKVKAIAPPDTPPRNETTLTGNHLLNSTTVANLNPALAVELGLDPEDQGVIVTDTVSRRIVTIGDIIREINGQTIKTVKDVETTLKKPSPRGWQLIIESNGQKRQILIR